MEFYYNYQRKKEVLLETTITVCYGKSCRSKNSEDIIDAIQARINNHECPIMGILEMNINVKLCNKFCSDGPWLSLNSDLFLNMTVEKSLELIEAIENNDMKKIMSFNPINTNQALSS